MLLLWLWKGCSLNRFNVRIGHKNDKGIAYLRQNTFCVMSPLPKVSAVPSLVQVGKVVLRRFFIKCSIYIHYYLFFINPICLRMLGAYFAWIWPSSSVRDFSSLFTWAKRHENMLQICWMKENKITRRFTPYIYLVATVEEGAAAVRFLGLGVVPSRNPFLKRKHWYYINQVYRTGTLSKKMQN